MNDEVPLWMVVVIACGVGIVSLLLTVGFYLGLFAGGLAILRWFGII